MPLDLRAANFDCKWVGEVKGQNQGFVRPCVASSEALDCSWKSLQISRSRSNECRIIFLQFDFEFSVGDHTYYQNNDEQ